MTTLNWNELLSEYNKLTFQEMHNVKSLLRMSLRVDFDNFDIKTQIRDHMIKFENIESQFAQLFQGKFYDILHNT